MEGIIGHKVLLESMGGKQYFRCRSVNIGRMYKQEARKSFVWASKRQKG